jgi:hypothetical protein
MAINASSIVSEYGAYYINSGQNKSRLLQKLLFGRETVKYARKVKTDDTVYRMANDEISSVVQPFQKAWTPKGDVTFKPNPIQLFKMKVDMEIYPDEIEYNWLGFLASDNLSRKEWPLIRYIMEVHLMKKIDDDLELKEYYKGVYAAPTAGTAGNTGTSMDGLKKLLQKKAGINRLDMDDLETTTIYDQIEEAFESIEEVYQNKSMIVAVAPSWRRAFLKDKREMGRYDFSGPNQIDDTLDFAPAKVAGLPSMIGTDDLWITPGENFLHITKKGQNAAQFRIEESKRCVNIMTDWWEGLGFGINEVVWTNVAAVS